MKSFSRNLSAFAIAFVVCAPLAHCSESDTSLDGCDPTNCTVGCEKAGYPSGVCSKGECRCLYPYDESNRPCDTQDGCAVNDGGCGTDASAEFSRWNE